MKTLQRLCPHLFGWSYNTHRRRRWCRLCAQQQRRDTNTDQWINVAPPALDE